MKQTIKVARFAEPITYNTKDIQKGSGGFYYCNGMGDETGMEYELTFDAFGNLAMVEKL